MIIPPENMTRHAAFLRRACALSSLFARTYVHLSLRETYTKRERVKNMFSHFSANEKLSQKDGAPTPVIREASALLRKTDGAAVTFCELLRSFLVFSVLRRENWRDIFMSTTSAVVLLLYSPSVVV